MGTDAEAAPRDCGGEARRNRTWRSPKMALSVGLKVDVDAVPVAVATALKAGHVDLDDPASTLVLLKANAIVGLTGHFDAQGTLTSVGVQCAFCHSTVDDSFALASVSGRTDGRIAT